MTDRQLPTVRDAVAGAEPERIERFQALQAGQYWRAQRKIPKEGIAEGEVLLIQSIRWVDDAPHTVILRPHPTHIGRDYEVRTKDAGGKTRIEYRQYDEHRFLLKDFLNFFEFEPDHQRIRTRELQQVQGQVQALQTELLETQTDPQRMALVVEEGLKAKAEEEQRERGGKRKHTALLPAAPTPQVVSLATGSIVDAISAELNEAGIAEIKRAAEREGKIATVKAKWIQAKTTEISETIQAMTPFYEEQAAAALAQTEDVRSYVAKLLQGIESLDLYVGKGVDVETICEGAAAPADAPLTFMQRKLLMDEELALWADVDEKFDFTSEKRFFEALRENAGLIDQIFPTPRCILVMATTRRDIDYADNWANVQRNRENKKVFLLIRNGGNVHRVFSPVESHLGASRLFPTKDDQDRIFRGFDGREIKFEDVAYTDKLKVHELHALHYKRFLLLACGLDHRLKLFGEFYPGPPSMQFMSLEFQEEYCRFLSDDPESHQLLGTAHPSVKEWIAQKNAYLRSGSRVLCNWGELMNPATAPAACKRGGGGRYDSFYTQYRPDNEFDVVIAYREGSSICVDIEVSGELRRSCKERTFTCKINLSKLKGDWAYVDLPFLCLDTVSAEDVRWYMHNRESRRDHLDFIRFFKRALKHVQHELAVEKSAREQLFNALVEGKLADGEEARTIVSQAVVAWRAAHRGNALPTFDGTMTTEWTSLLDQMYMLAGNGKRQMQEVETVIRGLGLEPLRLVLSGGAKLLAYAAPSVDERDDRLVPHAWVHCITLERGKTKMKEKARRWALLPPSAAAETTLHEWEGAAEWVHTSTAFGSFERKQTLLEDTFGFRDALQPWIGAPAPTAQASRVDAWLAVRSAYNSTGRFVRNPEMAVPIGLLWYPRAKQLRYLCVGTRVPHAVLYQQATTEELKAKIRSRYIGTYANKQAAAKRFDEEVAQETPWVLMELTIDSLPDRHGYLPADGSGRTLDHRDFYDPRLATWLAKFRKDLSDHGSVWMAPGVYEGTQCQLDTLLGIKLPTNFEPVTITEVTLHAMRGEAPLPKYYHWYDISPRSDEEATGTVSIIRGQRSPGVPEGFGYSSSANAESTREAGRKYIARDIESGERAVLATDLPDAPPAPEGVERWYVIRPDGQA